MIKKIFFEKQKWHKLHEVISEYKKEKKIKINKNDNNSNKTLLKILFNVREQYLYSRAKPRSITLNIMQ